MKKEFLGRMTWRSTYVQAPGSKGTYYASFLADAIKLKAGTKERNQAISSAYYAELASGKEVLLPYCISRVEGLKISRSGRGLAENEGQLKSYFKSIEVSRYKVNAPYRLQTTIWRVPGYGCLYYGKPATSQSNGKMSKDNGDLLMIYTESWERLEVFVFKGMARVDLETLAKKVVEVVY